VSDGERRVSRLVRTLTLVSGYPREAPPPLGPSPGTANTFYYACAPFACLVLMDPQKRGPQKTYTSSCAHNAMVTLLLFPSYPSRQSFFPFLLSLNSRLPYCQWRDENSRPRSCLLKPSQTATRGAPIKRKTPLEIT
jgi:hypothetical protein